MARGWDQGDHDQGRFYRSQVARNVAQLCVDMGVAKIEAVEREGTWLGIVDVEVEFRDGERHVF